MKLVLRIAYLGKGYNGWQVQPGKLTVQGEICKAAYKLFGRECDVTGCSRTDSAVNANEFVAAVTEHGKPYLETAVPSEKITRAFCSLLPNDICVYGVAWVDESFHPRYDVERKEYVYRIFDRAEMSPFEVDRAYHFPHRLSDAAIEQMALAAKHFEGKHDFTSFMAQGSKITDAVRNVYSADVRRGRDENIVEFTVSADGFLYNMVRIMTGTLIDVGKGKRSSEDIDGIILTKDRSAAGETAPACGLYLNRVIYKKNIF